MSSKRKGIIAVVVVLVVAALAMGVMVWRNSKVPPITADCGTGITTIYYTAQQAFVPSCIKVPSGTTITYTNQSSDVLSVGPNPHPIHSGNKEVSGGNYDLEVKPGESGQATLTKKGSFGIHDHNHSSAVAVIVVE